MLNKFLTMDSSNVRDNYFTPTHSIHEETCVKDYTEAEAEGYIKVQGLSFKLQSI